ELLHPGREMRGLTDRGVVHVQIAVYGADDDLARVEPDADLHIDALAPAQLVGIPADRLLHAQRRVARAHRVILVGDRRAEERHDPVAHDLVDRALVAVDRLHHPLEDGVEDPARLFRIAVGEELHRALDVGEEHGHQLALALELGTRGEDFVCEVFRSVVLRVTESAPRRRGARRQCRAAAAAESRLGRYLGAAARAGARETRAALLAEPGAFAATSLAAR